jgi:hypothetical protein
VLLCWNGRVCDMLCYLSTTIEKDKTFDAGTFLSKSKLLFDSLFFGWFILFPRTFLRRTIFWCNKLRDMMMSCHVGLCLCIIIIIVIRVVISLSLIIVSKKNNVFRPYKLQYISRWWDNSYSYSRFFKKI